jgi:hypothetical protein
MRLNLPYNLPMKKDKVIKKAGSQVALAKILGISQAAVAQWGETIPKAREWQLRYLKPEWFDLKEKLR